ncbi:MAG: DUF3473 domain-containing protein [Phycisphaerales bacterium]|nr:MAG: DUF3473 domain-containing protein [Phycisphaerales bacterium]
MRRGTRPPAHDSPPDSRTGHAAAPAGARPTGIPGVIARPLATVADGPHRPFPFDNAFSVDLEDWQQSVLDRSLPVSTRFVAPTYRLAELLETVGVRATFFVLGNAALASPRLVADLAAAGHEMQIHGFDHQLVHRMSPEEFRQDLLRTRNIVQDITGRPVFGYRAPRFSIDHRCPWAFEVLAECGFRYDASIVPMRVRGYGVAAWPRDFCRVRTRCGRELIEAPVAVGSVLGIPLPIGGGGFARLWPWAILRRQFDKLKAAGRPAVFYCHPHEFDPDGLAHLAAPVPGLTRLHQGLGRRAMIERVRRLLQRYRFGPIESFLGPTVLDQASMPVHRAAPAPRPHTALLGSQ